MKKLIYILVLFISSCGYEKKLAKWCERCPKETKTEIIYTERFDTAVVVTPADSAWYYALVECMADSAGKYIPVVINSDQVQTPRTKVKVSLSSGQLKVNCQSLEDSIQVLVKQIEKKEVQSITKVVPKILPLKWWQKFLIWAGAIFLIILTIKLTWFIAKQFPQLKALNAIGWVTNVLNR